MTTWLHEQRLTAVRDAVLQGGARTVLDLGCGDGDLLIRLTGERQIETIVGIDQRRDALQRLRRRLDTATGQRHARVHLVHGSMIEAHAALRNFDCAILVETIEHVDPERLSVLERAVFGGMRPGRVVITTPNADFNPALGVPAHRFRNPDHRFEWGRAKFEHWVRGVAGRNGYCVARSDIAGSHPGLGGASQMAVFERHTQGGTTPAGGLAKRTRADI